MSLDGKISTGSTDNMDIDKDFPTINGLKEGLHQYYEIKQTTDLWSLNLGKVQSKIGVNDQKTPVSFVIIDNNHLNENGVKYFCELSKNFVLITINKNHPALKMKEDNLSIILQERLSLAEALKALKKNYNCERLTIQSGGTLNSLFIREKLIDYVDIVVAPALIGGENTSTLMDGESLAKIEDLDKIGILELENVIKLDNSYLRLQYKVKNHV